MSAASLLHLSLPRHARKDASPLHAAAFEHAYTKSLRGTLKTPQASEEARRAVVAGQEIRPVCFSGYERAHRQLPAAWSAEISSKRATG